MTKYAVAHYDMFTDELQLSILEAANEVEASAKMLFSIDSSYDYTELVLSKSLDDLRALLSEEISIVVLAV